MLYGYKNDKELKTVIGAATLVTELENWYNSLRNEFYKSKKETDFFDILSNPEFAGYKHPAYIFHHDTTTDQENFIKNHEIIVLTPTKVKNFMLDMVENQELANNISTSTKKDKRTLKEILNLSENDPWDKRSQEVKEQQKELEKKREEIKKQMADQIAGHSFGPKNTKTTKQGVTITDIVGGQDSIKVKGIKVGEKKSSNEIKIPDSFNLLKNKKYTFSDVETLLSELTNIGSSEEEINYYKSIFEENKKDDENINELGKLLDYEISYSKVSNALEPISIENKTNDEILNIFSEKLTKTKVLDEEEIKNILESIKESLNYKLPKPSDFKYCFNQKLTENPSVGGKDCPVFNIDMVDNESQFIIYDIEGILLPEDGWEFFSGDMILNTKLSAEEAKNVLKNKGFVEDPDMIENQIKEIKNKILKNKNRNETLTPEQVANALKGDGTSTVSITGSYGEKKVIDLEDNKNIKTGISNERGAIIDIYENLVDVAYENLSDTIKKLLGKKIKKILKQGGSIKIGAYNGHINGEVYNIIETEDLVFRPDLSVNIKDLGGNKLGNIISRNISVDKKNYHSIIILIEKEKNMLIITI